MRPRKNDRAALYANPAYRRLLQVLAANLRALRAERKWTQEQAAEHCDLAVIQYVRVETAKTNVTFITLARVAEGYAVSADQLLRAPTPAAASSVDAGGSAEQAQTLVAAEPASKYRRRVPRSK